MPKSVSELLLYGLIVAGFLLFNYVMQQLAKKARQEQERAEALAPPPEAVLPEDISGRAPAAPPAAPEPVAPGVLARRAEARAPLRRRTAAELFFRTRKDLRQAVVVMTVLGPCRAQEPPDSR